MHEDDPKKRALIDAKKMLRPCPLCGKSDTVSINADIIGFTMIECSCGLSVGPLHNVWEAVDRYNNRAGEEKYKYEMYMMEERLQAMYDDYSRLLEKYKTEVSGNATD